MHGHDLKKTRVCVSHEEGVVLETFRQSVGGAGSGLLYSYGPVESSPTAGHTAACLR